MMARAVTPTIVKKVVVGVPITSAAGDGPLADQVLVLQQQYAALPTFTISSTPPENPQVGDVWIDTSSN